MEAWKYVNNKQSKTKLDSGMEVGLIPVLKPATARVYRRLEIFTDRFSLQGDSEIKRMRVFLPFYHKTSHH